MTTLNKTYLFNGFQALNPKTSIEFRLNIKVIKHLNKI